MNKTHIATADAGRRCCWRAHGTAHGRSRGRRRLPAITRERGPDLGAPRQRRRRLLSRLARRWLGGVRAVHIASKPTFEPIRSRPRGTRRRSTASRSTGIAPKSPRSPASRHAKRCSSCPTAVPPISGCRRHSRDATRLRAFQLAQATALRVRAATSRSHPANKPDGRSSKKATPCGVAFLFLHATSAER